MRSQAWMMVPGWRGREVSRSARFAFDPYLESRRHWWEGSVPADLCQNHGVRPTSCELWWMVANGNKNQKRWIRVCPDWSELVGSPRCVSALTNCNL